MMYLVLAGRGFFLMGHLSNMVISKPPIATNRDIIFPSSQIHYVISRTLASIVPNHAHHGTAHHTPVKWINRNVRNIYIQ